MLKRCAGVLIPLFSLRTGDDLGRGEIGDLMPMGELALAMGHRLVQLLPIDEIAPGETSPYSALSVFAIDPAYVSIHRLPGMDLSIMETARRAARADGIRVNPANLYAVKRRLLEYSYRYFQEGADKSGRDAFHHFIESQCEWIHDYALFRALKERFGVANSWETWPRALAHRDSRACADAARELADTIAMLQYFQFVAHRQWVDVRTRLQNRGVMIGGDLAFSPARESAEVWAHRDLFDLDRSVGAPPDDFSATGQRWGLPMPNWNRMRGSGFALIQARMRRARELYDVLRVDHVVGLFRTYGYPLGDNVGGSFDPPSAQAQRAQGVEILRVILREAGDMQIVAEDLGLIPAFVRASLAMLGVPGYKVARWEKRVDKPGAHSEHFLAPAAYPEASLVTTGTHDTETLSEWWAEISSDERRRFLTDLQIRDRADWQNSAMSQRTLDAILEALYASPARLVAVPMQDLFGWNDRVNLPGTIGEHNWTWRLPFELEWAAKDPGLRARLDQLRKIAERSERFHPHSA
jgi:4-alpha-glucanotransferase